MKDVKFVGETRRLINNAMKGMTPRDVSVSDYTRCKCKAK